MKKAVLFAIITISFACKTSSVPKNEINTETLIFQSRFEKNSSVITRPNGDADIVGKDERFSSHSDWVTDLDNHPEIGNFNLQFQGGDSTMRFARITPEPGNASNQVLQFWLDKPNVEASKGRIQANLYGNKGWKEFYQSVRVYLADDFTSVRKFPKKIDWLTIAEFWNNVTWSQQIPYGFRITLGIGKPTDAEGDLEFILDAQDCELFADGKQKYTTIWAEKSGALKVPIGKWFQMDYYYKEGKDIDGRFYLAITPQGEEKKVVFDVRKTTHNTHDPNPDGVTDFNPLKLYTSKELIQFMQSQGKTLQIFWDDFELWKDKKP